VQDNPSTIRFTLNRQAVEATQLPGQTLLEYLRDDAGLRATRMGCGLGQCGACRVLVDGRSTLACEVPLWSVADKAVTTLEGLGSADQPHPLQTAFVQEQALQCGFCTSGMIMAAAALLERDPHPDDAAIAAALDPQLCRCGVHPRVLRAVARVARP